MEKNRSHSQRPEAALNSGQLRGEFIEMSLECLLKLLKSQLKAARI